MRRGERSLRPMAHASVRRWSPPLGRRPGYIERSGRSMRWPRRRPSSSCSRATRSSERTRRQCGKDPCSRPVRGGRPRCISPSWRSGVGSCPSCSGAGGYSQQSPAARRTSAAHSRCFRWSPWRFSPSRLPRSTFASAATRSSATATCSTSCRCSSSHRRPRSPKSAGGRPPWALPAPRRFSSWRLRAFRSRRSRASRSTRR